MNTKAINDMSEFVGGFTLGGWRQKSGEIIDVSEQTTLADWPEAIEAWGTVYMLEEVSKHRVDEDKGQFENAEYC